MKKARMGFIGAGNFIRVNHLLTAKNCPFMEIRAIADLDEANLATLASRMPIGYTTTDYTRLLQDPDVDIIVIGTKQDLHAKLIVESLDAGKWTFCEKPMAETTEEGEAVIAAEKRAPGRLAIGLNRRFAPSYARAKTLTEKLPRPWYVNYRLMYPNPMKDGENNFYSQHPRVLYEGCHILDYLSHLFGEAPAKVYMTGDRIRNNCCILSYADGSQAQFMCGSMGSYQLWKEYMEIFANFASITVQDFVDMRVRGMPGEFDSLHAPQLGEKADEVFRWGFDFYEAFKSKEMEPHFGAYYDTYQMELERVIRPQRESQFNVYAFRQENPELWGFVPDKGTVQSFEHFAEAFLKGEAPRNADGVAGKLSTDIALALLESLEQGMPVPFRA